MNISAVCDLPNLIVKLERLSKKINVSIAEYPLLKAGDSNQCVDFAKRVIFYVAKEAASDMISRRCTEQSPNKRVVLALYDILREKERKSQSISAEQFLGEVVFCRNKNKI